MSARESDPQGELMGLRVWEGGESECLPVMGRIGVAPSGNITPRESGQTSTWLLVTRKLGKPPQEGKQMTAGIVLAGAPSSGAVHVVAPSVHREVVTSLSQRVLPGGL